MAGYRQGVDNHLFYGLDPGHLGLPDDQTFTGGFHHLRCYAIELINAGTLLVDSRVVAFEDGVY
jgi:hypothetical protein